MGGGERRRATPRRLISFSAQAAAERGSPRRGERWSDAGERSEGELWFRSPSATSGFITAIRPRQRNFCAKELAQFRATFCVLGRGREIYIPGGEGHELSWRAGIFIRTKSKISPGACRGRAGCGGCLGAHARSRHREKLVVAPSRNMAEARRFRRKSGAVSDDLGCHRIELDLHRSRYRKLSSGNCVAEKHGRYS